MSTERNISFTTPMVQAIREGRKTVTRRILRSDAKWQEGQCHITDPKNFYWNVGGHAIKCPYGKPGTILRVKEAAWMWCEKRPDGKTKKHNAKFRYVPVQGGTVHYAADSSKPQHPGKTMTGNAEYCWRLKIPRFLPAWAVRTKLKVVSIRVERLQDITEKDAEREGAPMRGDETVMGGLAPDQPRTHHSGFRILWNSINGAGAWDANPWVWVVAFEVLEKETK